jgi:hypothetical protein
MNAKSFILYAALFPFVALLVGCAALFPPMERVQPVKELPISLSVEASNQFFLEQTVDNLNLSGALRSKLPPGSNVALVSMEESITLDAPIVALIEDQLIRSLVANNFHVRERDEHIVRRMVQERLEDSYIMISESTSTPYMAESMEKRSDLWPPFLRTQLSSADFLISYRILEIGIAFLATDMSAKNLDRSVGGYKRQGLVRLHIRVQDAKTGEIVFRDNLQGVKEEEVSADMKSALERKGTFRYTFFPYDYPLQSGP